MLKGKLPSEVVNERHQYVNAVRHYIEEEKRKLNELMQELGFNEESLMKVEPKQLCPYNADHFVPEKSFKKHVEKCRLLKAGYQIDELPSQLANTDYCYEGKTSLKVEIDESLLNKIIWDDCVKSGEVYTGHRSLPVSHIDENINITQNDRLALYHYAVNKSHEEGKAISVDKTDELLTTDWSSLVKKGLLDAQNNEKYSSKLEQLAALRDLKRRRQSYRAKNVHITKKSYTEIIREVIVNQMEVLVPAKNKGEDISSGGSSIRLDESNRREQDIVEFKHSSSRQKRSRSRSREKRHRYDKRSNEVGNQCEVKVESLSVQEQVLEKEIDFGDKSNLVGKYDKNQVNSQNSPKATKRRRSSSPSSFSSSDEERRSRHHHKKSKHKKKSSKHSKKHSKKHKR